MRKSYKIIAIVTLSLLAIKADYSFLAQSTNEIETSDVVNKVDVVTKAKYLDNKMVGTLNTGDNKNVSTILEVKENGQINDIEEDTDVAEVTLNTAVENTDVTVNDVTVEDAYEQYAEINSQNEEEMLESIEEHSVDVTENNTDVIVKEIDFEKNTEFSMQLENVDSENVNLDMNINIDISDSDVQENLDVKMITAYAVYIDDEYIGTVSDVSLIENTLNLLKQPYESIENLVSLSFDKNISYDKEIEMDENLLTNPQDIVDKLLSTEGVARYYEVVPGDCPSIIADKLDLTTAEVCSLPVYFDGELVDDISKDCRVGMLIQYQSERKFIHVLIEKNTVYTDMVAYDSVSIEDETMLEGTYKVETEGQYGVIERTFREVIDDNNIINSVLLSETIVQEPVSEVIRVGTAKPLTQVNLNKNAGGSGEYFWPVGDNSGYISAYFGDGRHHKGIDIAAPKGTPIYAAASGTIQTTNTSGWGGGYGNYVLISGDDGYDTMYGHMSYVADGISSGVYVTRGQLIGYVGSTGDSTGNHCHFEVRYKGSYLNPTEFVSK